MRVASSSGSSVASRIDIETPRSDSSSARHAAHVARCCSTPARRGASSTSSRYALRICGSHSVMSISLTFGTSPAFKAFAKLPTGAEESGLDGPAWNIENLCDLIITQLLDLPQNEHLAEVFGQPAQNGRDVDPR